MKTVIDYLKEHGKYEHDFQGRDFELELVGERILLKRENGKEHIIDANQKGYYIEIAIQDILELDGIEIRFCEECGTPFDAGFMANDGGWYSCEECFESAMDRTYGKGKWRPSEYEGAYGGWYEYLDEDEWEDTSIFYTEWY
jgi:hypothetical protein